MTTSRDSELVARAAQAANSLDTVAQLYGKVGDLSALPGPDALRALGQHLALLAGDMLARAEELDRLTIDHRSAPSPAGLTVPRPDAGPLALRSPSPPPAGRAQGQP